MATRPDAFAERFVPAMPEVLFAARLLQPSRTDRLSFTAPTEPGDDPFVCTFPGHRRRMYGTLHVVAGLDDVPPEALAPPENVDVPARPPARIDRAALGFERPTSRPKTPPSHDPSLRNSPNSQTGSCGSIGEP